MKIVMVKRLLKNAIYAVGALALSVAACGCDHVDFDRIPPANVRLSFDTRAEWERYGTPGALDHRRFILDGNLRVPSDFPWTGLTYTGFGGILLVGDLSGAPYAYDLACPVEVNRNVRIEIDTQEMWLTALNAARAIPCSITMARRFRARRASSSVDCADST